MTRVVPDTNVLVSGLFWRGPPRRILELARSGRLGLFWCPEAERELTRVLAYPRFGLQTADIVRIVRAVGTLLTVVPIADPCGRIADDPADNVFLTCAVTVRADAIISGDHHLLSLGGHEGIPILRPADFLDRFCDLLR